MPAREPGDWPQSFSHHLNAGELDAVMALYASEANFVAASGEILCGRERIRPVIAGLIARKTRMYGRVLQVVRAGDVAVLYTNWEGSSVEPSGARIEYRSRSVEVVRRQPDGSWQLVVGDPGGRD
jgi:uncharacterized protein (TIGR02246 family)